MSDSIIFSEREFEFIINENIDIIYNMDKDVWYAHHQDEEKFEEDEILDRDWKEDMELFEGTYTLTNETFSIMKNIVSTEDFKKSLLI